MAIFTIGIDPGKKGALALLADGAYHGVMDWHDGPTTVAALRHWLDLYPPRLVALERVHAMPKQGVVSTFSFGQNFGWWKGALDALSAPWLDVTPQAWQSGLGLKKIDSQGKPALSVAQRLFPEAPLTGPRGGAKDGRADALLIAHWAYRQTREN